MIGAAPESEFDLRFPLFGIPIRVHPVFWLTSAFISWNNAMVGDQVRMDLLVLSVLVVFISILVHELGHAVVMRIFGYPSEIVLYFFGGYATAMRKSTWKDIAGLAAGPAAGFALYGLTWVTAEVLISQGTLLNMDPVWRLRVAAMLDFSLWANFVWNVFNLIPVMPLDGGQICRELCLWISPRKGMEWAFLIAIGVSGLLALYGFGALQGKWRMIGSVAPGMPTIFFGVMCYQNFQAYQASKGRRY